MSRIFQIIFLGGLLELLAPISYACFCVVPDISNSVENARAVFIGKVTEIKEPASSDPTASLSDRLFIIKFKIQRSWKGINSGVTEYQLLAAQNGYSCFSYPPVKMGETYLVYADPVPRNLNQSSWSMIHNCNRTRKVQFEYLKPDEIAVYDEIKLLDAMVN